MSSCAGCLLAGLFTASHVNGKILNVAIYSRFLRRYWHIFWKGTWWSFARRELWTWFFHGWIIIWNKKDNYTFFVIVLTHFWTGQVTVWLRRIQRRSLWFPETTPAMEFWRNLLHALQMHWLLLDRQWLQLTTSMGDSMIMMRLKECSLRV